jgi:HEAT repeat protein
VCQAHLVEISVGPDQIQRWIVQLDDEDYTVREQASRHLERVGGEAHPALERTLKGDCSPEVRQRIKALLEANLIRIRKMRAVELLEQIGTAEAVDFLKQLAMKTSDPGLRAEAEGSLRRLGTKRRAP